MNIKEKREFLSEYRNIQGRIAGLTNEITKWKTIGEKVNSAMSATGVMGGDNTSKVERSAVNTSDIIRDIQKEIDAALEQRRAIIEAIQTKCKRMRYREVLKMHFINGMSIQKMARTYGKEDKTISNMITVAIKELNI